jgi:virginiamycin A acetyltransferase
MMDLGPDLWMTYLKDQHEVFRNVQANPQKPGTVIGHDVWIAQDVSIMRGLTIGDGAVIAAAAVVTKDVPPYAIVGGNPARIIRFRFPPDIIDALMLMRWWRYSYTHFNKIDLSDIRRTIQELQPILADLPEYTPSLINLSEMPNDGIV